MTYSETLNAGIHGCRLGKFNISVPRRFGIGHSKILIGMRCLAELVDVLGQR